MSYEDYFLTKPQFPLPFSSLINADFCVGSVCVAFGAILGKTSPIQLLVMTLFQVTLFAVNEYILLNLLHVRLSAVPLSPWPNAGWKNRWADHI